MKIGDQNRNTYAAEEFGCSLFEAGPSPSRRLLAVVGDSAAGLLLLLLLRFTLITIQEQRRRI